MRATLNSFQIILILVIAGFTAFIFLMGKDDAAVFTKQVNKIDKDSLRRSFRQSKRDLGKKNNYKAFKQEALAKLSDSLKEKINSFAEVESDVDLADTSTYSKKVGFWKNQEQLLIAAHYQQKLAEKGRQADQWTRAAKLYQQVRKSTKDSVKSSYAVSKSINCYQQVLEKNPENLNAKVDLALAYIEGRQVPMKGVRLLKDVIKKEPDNRKALYYLGALSMQSGQFDKALERFQKLVRIQPENPFNHLYLGNVHEQLGNKEKAIEAYQKYRELVKQPKLKVNVNEKIKSLKQELKK